MTTEYKFSFSADIFIVLAFTSMLAVGAFPQNHWIPWVANILFGFLCAVAVWTMVCAVNQARNATFFSKEHRAKIKEKTATIQKNFKSQVWIFVGSTSLALGLGIFAHMYFLTAIYAFSTLVSRFLTLNTLKNILTEE